MRWKIVGLFFFLGPYLIADENIQSFDANPLFVSLGSHCEVAVKLRENGLRKVAFPFDWLVTLDNERFNTLLDEDFEFFLDENLFFQDPAHPYMVENDHYKIEFRHDWPFSDPSSNSERFSEQLQKIQSKYAKRISRFRQLRDYPGKVFFIRLAYDFFNSGPTYWWDESQANLNENHARRLKDALDRFFPCLDFTLVIINYAEEKIPSFKEIDGVFEYKVKKSHKHEDYRALFETLQQLHSFSQSLPR